MEQRERFSTEETPSETAENQEATTRKTLRLDGMVTEALRNAQERGIPYRETPGILFQDKNGREADFSELLPEGWTFISFDEWKKINPSRAGMSVFFADPYGKKIAYGDFSKDGSLFTLLHEIGHARLEEQGRGFSLLRNGLDLMEYVYTHKNRELGEHEITARGEAVDDYELITVYDPMGKGTGGQDNDEVWFSMFVPKALIVRFGKEWAADERSAWAYALRTLRRLRKKGFAIEQNLEKLHNLQNELYSHLATYEKNYEKEYRDTSSPFLKGKEFTKKNIND